MPAGKRSRRPREGSLARTHPCRRKSPAGIALRRGGIRDFFGSHPVTVRNEPVGRKKIAAHPERQSPPAAIPTRHESPAGAASRRGGIRDFSGRRPGKTRHKPASRKKIATPPEGSLTYSIPALWTSGKRFLRWGGIRDFSGRLHRKTRHKPAGRKKIATPPEGTLTYGLLSCAKKTGRPPQSPGGQPRLLTSEETRPAL